MDYQLIETKDDEAFIERSVDFLADAITDAIDERGHCILGLSGGKTPHAIYERLAQTMNVEWGRVHLFLIDERCVPSSSADSNRHLLDSTLLRYGAIDVTERCVFPDASLPPQECAEDYARRLRALFDNLGTADLLVLGLGEDGHTASLFPPVTEEAFGEKLAIHTTTDRFAVRDRISLTVPPLHRAHKQCFFLNGDAKKKVWEEMMASEEGERRWPAKGIMAFGETTVIARW
jgi:6-phosphogluconolactonase